MASTAPVFTVKATYRSETRKFSFPQSTFPTYDQLYDQLYRVFPISHSFCLSRILFSPNADNPSSRILIGTEAHNAAEYDAHIAPYKNREWPGALLRLSVSDETPHKVPNGREKNEVPEKAKPTSSRGRHRHPAPASQRSSQKDEDKEKQQETTAAAASFIAQPSQGIHIGLPQMSQNQAGSVSPAARISLQLGDKSWQLSPLSNGENASKVCEGADNGVAWKVTTDPHSYKVEVNNDMQSVASASNTGANNPSIANSGNTAPTSGAQNSCGDPYAASWRESIMNSLADEQQQSNATSGNAPPAPPRPSDPYTHIRRPLSSYLSHTSPMPRDLPHPPHHFPYPPPSPSMAHAHFFPMPPPPPPPPHLHTGLFFPYVGPPPPPPPPPPPFAAPPPMVYVQPPTPAFDRRPSAAAPKSRPSARFLSPEAAMRPADKPAEKRPRTEEARVQRLQLARAMAADARKKIDPIQERVKEPEVEVATNAAKEEPCCDVQQGKEEVQALVDRFAADLERVLKNTFGEGVRGIEVAQLFATNQDKDKGKGKEVSKEEAKKAPKDQVIEIELQKNDKGKYDFNFEELIHLGILCDMCDKTIVGTRHKCTECADYDLCDPCLLTLQHLIAYQYGTFEPGFERSNDSLPHPASHKFAVIEHPQARSWKRADDGFWRVRSPAPNDKEEAASVSGATVGGEQTVFGGFGEAVPAQQREAEAFRAARDAVVETFEDASSVNDTALPRSDAFNAARDAVVQSFANPPSAPLASGFAEAMSEHTAPEAAPAQENPRMRHLATCDLCDSNIRGARYKCVDCPDFDTCSSCFAIVNEQHPRHTFARITNTADLIRGSGWRVAQSAQATHPARCDSCDKAVVGVRYKCMHPACPDFDLCAPCEALPIAVHPDTHPLLKIKTPGSIIPAVRRYGDAQSPLQTTKPELETEEQPQDLPQEETEKPMPRLEMPNPFATPPGASQPLPDEDSTILSPGRTATPDYVEDMVRRLEARERADCDSHLRRESWRAVWEAPAPEQEPLIRLDEQAQLPRVQPTDFNELFDLASQFRHLLDAPPEVRERERGGVRRAYRSVVVADDVGVPSAAEVVEQPQPQTAVKTEEEKRQVRAAYRQLGEAERVAVPSDVLDADIVTAVRVPTPATVKDEAETKMEEPLDEEKRSIRAAYRQLDAETGSEQGASVAIPGGSGEPEVVLAKSTFDDRGEERRRRSRATFRRSMQPGPVDESLAKKLCSDNAVLEGDVNEMGLRPKTEEERRAVRAGYRQLATGSNASVGVPGDFGDLGVIVSATTDAPRGLGETEMRERTEGVLKSLKRAHVAYESFAESDEDRAVEPTLEEKKAIRKAYRELDSGSKPRSTVAVPDDLDDIAIVTATRELTPTATNVQDTGAESTLEEKKAIRKAYRQLDSGSEPRSTIAVPDDLDDIAIVTAVREPTPAAENVVEDAPIEQTAEEKKNTRAAFRNMMQSGPVDKRLLQKLASPGAVLDPELGSFSDAGLLPRTWGDVKERQKEDDEIEIVPSEQSPEERRSIRGAYRRMMSETASQTRPAVAVPDDLDNVMIVKTNDEAKPAPARLTPEEKHQTRTRYRNLMQRVSPAYSPVEATAAQDPALEILSSLKGRFLVKKPADADREKQAAEEALLEEKRAIRKAYRDMALGEGKGKEAVAAPSDVLDNEILVSSARPQSAATSEAQTDAAEVEVPTPTPQEIRAAYRKLAQPSSDGQSTATVSVPTEATFSSEESAPALLVRTERTSRPGAVAPTSSSATSSRPTSFITDNSETVIVTADAPLRAAFVGDNNIPDGQMFPPGAEFVKSWRMRNDGTSTWPKGTELVFVAGDRMLFDDRVRFGVGSVKPGEEVDVWTGELKAPDVPGKYIGYWRLSDGQGNRFGHSIWIDITVTEPSVDAKDDSEGSLASSSVIMPRSAPERSSTMTSRSTHVAGQDEATTAPLSPDGSFSDSSVSLIDVPSDDEEDVFVDSRSHIETSPAHHSPEIDYVVLDDSSDED